MQAVLLKIKSLPVCFSANLWIKACRVYWKAAVSGVTWIGVIWNEIFICVSIFTQRVAMSHSRPTKLYLGAQVLRRVRKNPHGGSESSKRGANCGARILWGGCRQGRATDAEASQAKNPGGGGVEAVV